MITIANNNIRPGTGKRKLKKEVVFYPVINMVIEGNPMRDFLNMPLSTRGKARWAATKFIEYYYN